ncbi:DNA adenine methylase [Pseudomonas mosselii]|uniref:DNA adenine methylase n=1 Tax=Pseudomonas mosselii TaxID=78327 RepID=UPI00244D23F7|nr:DNA adenine methylase [Pseudomonas mosselii]MDH1509714.1 DNA adenine methylase [Pseudomonas mosselii]
MNQITPSGDLNSLIKNKQIIPSLTNDKKYFFRSLNYLGSKLRMLDTIGEVIDELSSPNDVVVDLFAGSGSVSRFLSQSRTVISADIQEYSRVICSAILTPSNSIQPEEIVERCRSSSMHAALTASCAEVIQYEEEAISRAFQGLPLQLCEFLEEGSFIKSADENYRNCTGLLERALKASYQKLMQLEARREGSCTATLYYGGIYFSFRQTAAIDAILYEIENSDFRDRDTLLAALLSAVSSAVNTIGKQFAQPIQPRMANGQPKKGIAVKVKKDREIDIFEVFFENLQRYVELSCSGLPHQALCMDYSEALDQLPKDTRVVYADPPYTRDHYSRFYHVLETLCLRDSPTVSRTKIGGSLRLSRGLYREQRHQSPFCIRSQAPQAFTTLFDKVSKLGASLVLSYSPHVVREGEHPRVMTIEDLTALARNHFQEIYTVCPGEFKHNKLNSRENSFEQKPHGEILIVCKN